MSINISRKNSLILGLIIIIVFFTAGIAMLMFSKKQTATQVINKEENQINSQNSQSATVLEQDKPNLTAPITMSKFERHAIRDGKKLWEVTADKGRYIPQTNSAELENSKLLFFRKDDSVIQIISNFALINFSGTDLKGADLSGNVELIYNDKVHIKSDNAKYDKNEDTITVPGDVSVDTEKLNITGKELVAYVSKHEVTINKDVVTIIQPRGKEQ